MEEAVVTIITTAVVVVLTWQPADWVAVIPARPDAQWPMQAGAAMR